MADRKVWKAFARNVAGWVIFVSITVAVFTAIQLVVQITLGPVAGMIVIVLTVLALICRDAWKSAKEKGSE